MNSICRSVLTIAAVVVAVCTMSSDCSADASFPDYDQKVKPFFQKHCIKCHGPKVSEGDMRFDQLSPVVSNEDTAETWQEVLDVLNAGEMPPEDEARPATDELAAVIGSLTDGLFEARKRLVDSRQVTLRRLNRREYANTIRDLLGVTIDTNELPADGTVDGFDTIGDAHFMSTVQFEKYLKLGRLALDRALVQGPQPLKRIQRTEPERVDKIERTIKEAAEKVADRKARLRSSDLTDDERRNLENRIRKESDTVNRGKGYLAQPGSNTGFILDITQAPFGGQGHDKVRAAVPSRPDRAESQELTAAGEELPVQLGTPIGRYVARFRAGLTCQPAPGQRLFVQVYRADTFNQQVSYSYPLGTYEISHTMDDPQVIEVPFENYGETDDNIAVKVSDLNLKSDSKPRRRGDTSFPDSTKKPYVWVDWLEVEGPFVEQWPPAAWTQTFFKGLPEADANESAYARDVIERFAFRAFRHRRPSNEFVDSIHGIYAEYRASGATFVTAVKEALAVILASPSFVYVVERPAENNDSARRLSDLELASRLSYFLWSHPPDDVLFALARGGQLSQQDVLRKQVERMLDDPKAETFFEAFTSQWLDLPWLDMIVVNEGRFSGFNEEVRRSLREECIQFVGQLIRDDLSAVNLIDSNFVMIDGVLADFYELDANRSQEFQKVILPEDSPRGGLIGQGAILTMTSTGERTSPVERGVFVYERLLGRPVPPPPPNVPQLEISSDRPLTIRETLNAHVEKAQCASCHRRMDPLGFGLEHFDAIGKWRDTEKVFTATTKLTANGRPRRSKPTTLNIDATGVMPDGERRFDGHEQLKSFLLEDQDQMAKGLLKSMLTYALGRRVGFADGEFVEHMAVNWKHDDYGMRRLIHAIVQSEEFQSK